MILDQLRNDLKQALKAKDEITASTLRFLLAAIQNKEIELKKRGKLKDEEVMVVIRKQVKQHQESIEAYQKGKREDLVEKEKKEMAVLGKYLPQQLSSKELEKIIDEVIEEVGDKDFGKVMGAVMGKVKGRVEGSEVAKVVKKHLDIV